MIETTDFIQNVKKHGSDIQNILDSIRENADFHEIDPNYDAIFKLKNLWTEMQNNTRLILSRVVIPVAIGVPDSFIDVAESCSEIIKWESYETIGSGNTGSTYAACRDSKCDYVIKRQPTSVAEDRLRATTKYLEHRSFRSELKALINLQAWKHAPKIYAAWTCQDSGYIVMEKLYKCNKGEKTYKKVKKIIDELYERGWIHMDAHPKNIMCRANGDLVLFDYGRARAFTDADDGAFAYPHPWVKTKDDVLTPREAYKIELGYIQSDFDVYKDEDEIDPTSRYVRLSDSNFDA
jgi:serine/threonine protein kinase